MEHEHSPQEMLDSPSPTHQTTQDIKPNVQNLNLQPQQYNGANIPLVTNNNNNNNNMEIATLFTMSFNQNFQTHN